MYKSSSLYIIVMQVSAVADEPAQRGTASRQTAEFTNGHVTTPI